MCDLTELVWFGGTLIAVYVKSGYQAIPCVIIVVDGVVTFVGPPQEDFKAALNEALGRVSLP
jgi:hypothetical protein